MVFVADDLAAWLIFILAEGGRKRLISLVLGDEQTHALRPAATEAVRLTAAELCSGDAQRAEELAILVSQLFRTPVPGGPLGEQETVLEALQVGIVEQLALLDDPGLTMTMESLTGMREVSATVLAQKLTGHLVRQIMVRGSRGGPLAPLADQLNHDVTHLQGQRLEGRLAQLAGQVTKLAEAGSVPLISGKPVRLLPRPAFLAGREDLLADLDARLRSGDGHGPRIVALHGLGGAGKTSVAVEYAHRHLSEVELAWQLPAEDATVLAAGFTDLAGQLGIGGPAGAGDSVAAVHAVLAGHPAEWLLVFDNIPGPEQVGEFLPPSGNGRVLITSRNALWPLAQAVEVPVLDVDVATGFLMDRADDRDDEAAHALAQELGGLPLALEQAAAYTRASAGTLARYLDLFQRRRSDVLARGGPAGYPQTVATTWALAFTHLEQSAPAAAGMLRLLAYCAPEAIPLGLLLQPRPRLTDDLAPAVAGVLAGLLDDELAVGDAVAALREYSLARPAGDGAVSVHRLVQAVTADQMPAKLAEAWRQATVAVIEAVIPEDPQQPDAWPVFAVLLPHALAALTFDSIGMSAIIRYLGASGSHVAARELQREVVGAQESKLGAEHPEALAARGNLAYWTGMAGDAAGARDQYVALLPVIERVSGAERPDTLITRGNIARWAGEAGDPAAARDQFAALLPLHGGVFGPEHPSTLSARGNLAHWIGMAGDAVGARDQYAALLPVEERVFGAEHPATLTTRRSLAFWVGQAGDVAGARDQYAALLPEIERVLGSEHPDTLTTRASFADFTAQAGDAAGARDQYAALLPVMEQVFGLESPDTLTARANLAQWTGLAGDAVGARDQFAALLPVRGQVSGPEHPETLAARGNLARWTGEIGDAAGARDQFAALLPVYERVLGLEHPDTLVVKSGLANWLGQAGDAVGSRDRYAALLPVRERVSGLEHPETLTVRANLAGWTGMAGDAVGARDQFAALLPVRERVSGQEHPDTLAARANLAQWTGLAGDAAGARDQYAALLPVYERVSGPEHPDTLTIRGNLAQWTGRAGDVVGARDQFAALLPVYERVLGPEHPDTLSVRVNLARWTGEAGDAVGARDQFAALLAVRRRVSGPRHPNALTAWERLAHWTGEAGDATGARDLYGALLPVIKRVSGPEHPDTLSVRAKLAYWTVRADEGRPEQRQDGWP